MFIILLLLESGTPYFNKALIFFGENEVISCLCIKIKYFSSFFTEQVANLCEFLFFLFFFFPGKRENLHEADTFLADNADFPRTAETYKEEKNRNWTNSLCMGRRVQVWEDFEGFTEEKKGNFEKN